MFGHRKCEYCEKMGHTKDMELHGPKDEKPRLYHPECWLDEMKKLGKVRCSCGEYWVNEYRIRDAAHAMGIPRVIYRPYPVPVVDAKPIKKKKAKKKVKK